MPVVGQIAFRASVSHSLFSPNGAKELSDRAEAIQIKYIRSMDHRTMLPIEGEMEYGNTINLCGCLYAEPK